MQGMQERLVWCGGVEVEDEAEEEMMVVVALWRWR